MALFDLHLLNEIQAGLPDYLTNYAAFAELFPGVDAGLTAEWFSVLSQSGAITFRDGWTTDTPKQMNNLIVVSLESEAFGDGALGQDVGFTAELNSRRETGFTITQSAEVLIMSKRSDWMRALHVLVRAVVTRAFKNFLTLNYSDLRYDGVGPLSPDETLFAEEAKISVRRMRFSCSEEVRLPDIPPGSVPVSKDFKVQLDIVEDDPERDPAPGCGTPGGVVPRPL